MNFKFYVIKAAFLSLFLAQITAPGAQAQNSEVQAPKEVPINIVLKNVTVREFKAPYKSLPVMVEKDVSRYPLLEITDETIFKKDKKNKLPITQVKQGMRVVVTIDYLQISNRAIAKEIQLDPGYYGSTSLEGIFEDINGERAHVDGHTVVMAKDKKIKGSDGWKGKEFKSFADMQLGSLLKLRGKRELDGVIYVESGTATPVLMAEDDRMLRTGMTLVMKVNLHDIKIGGKRSIPIESDPGLQDYVATIGNKLVPEYLKALPIDHPDRVDFRFYIAKNDMVNAAALPDGVVLINTGLLKVVKNEAQLSAVIGHEISHVLYKHHTAKMRNTNDWKNVPIAASMVASGLSGEEAGAGGGMMADVVSKMAMNSFSRKKESQADRIGLYYMVNAGYDPREAATFWQSRLTEIQQKRDEQEMKSKGKAMALSLTGDSALSDDEDDSEDDSAEALSSYDPTHPKLKDRYNNLNFLLATTYSNLDYNKVKTGEEDYTRFLEKLEAKEKPTNKSAPVTTNKRNSKPAKGKTSKTAVEFVEAAEVLTEKAGVSKKTAPATRSVKAGLQGGKTPATPTTKTSKTTKK